MVDLFEKKIDKNPLYKRLKKERGERLEE